MATVLKTVDPKGSVSSNLTVSTMVLVVKRLRPRIVIPIYVGSNPIMHPRMYSTAVVQLLHTE